MTGGERNGNLQRMQAINRAKVIDCIRRQPYTTRPLIARETGLAPSSITNLVSFLLEKGWVEEVSPEWTGTVGRRAMPLRLGGSRHRILLIGIRPGRVRARLMNLRGETVAEKSENLDTGDARFAEDFANWAALRKKEFEAEAGGDIPAVAVSLTGMVLDGGRRVESVLLRWRDADLLTPLRRALKAPVFLMNVSVAKAVWVAREAEAVRDGSALFFDLEDGVGMQHIFRGEVRTEILGEVGHGTVNPQGESCFCGNVGCLETVCSAEAAARAANEKIAAGAGAGLLPYAPAGKMCYEDLLAAERAGCAAAIGILQDCGRYLGVAVTTMVNLFHPDTVYLTDERLIKSPALFETACDWTRAHAYRQLVDELRFEKASVGEAQAASGLLNHTLNRLFHEDSPDCVFN